MHLPNMMKDRDVFCRRSHCRYETVPAWRIQEEIRLSDVSFCIYTTLYMLNDKFNMTRKQINIPISLCFLRKMYFYSHQLVIKAWDSFWKPVFTSNTLSDRASGVMSNNSINTLNFNQQFTTIQRSPWILLYIFKWAWLYKQEVHKIILSPRPHILEEPRRSHYY